ncbi:MAG: hypothetical protein ABI603_01100 [Acidobacteriota bacterium]
MADAAAARRSVPLELGARLSSQATVGVSTKLQRNLMTGRWSRSIALQATLKSVY